MADYTGVLSELGGAEIGQSGVEKPRRIIIKQDPNSQGKTFRAWSDSEPWLMLQERLGQTVTVVYEPEQRTGGPKGTYTQNRLVGVKNDGVGEGSRVWGSAQEPEPAQDWSVPKDDQQIRPDEPPKPVSRDDYWEQRAAVDEQRSLQMEAAWAVKAALDLGTQRDQVVVRAIEIAILKRQVASELSK